MFYVTNPSTEPKLVYFETFKCSNIAFPFNSDNCTSASGGAQ